MSWSDEAVFYHIYPLGLLGAPKKNDYGKPVHRLKDLAPWIDHMEEIGCSALYIGPLFQSGSHGYDTTDYRNVDSRLGTNEDLRDLTAYCHGKGIRVILDGVFNHTGRDFFAFQDLKKNRENSPYKDWYRGVNFWGNNEYNDGFSYENWGGYNLLAKLNLQNPAVRDYHYDTIRFWKKEFDIDGLRLDTADVLDFDFMRGLRALSGEIGGDFWLMGEVIHGEYSRWVNDGMLHSVTNYPLHKALWSGHNEHNYFEIAHTVRRLGDMGFNNPDGYRLYNFVDNHDVDRIVNKLNDRAQFTPVHVLLYALPGIPSIYYGSEFGIEGRKEHGSDDPIRPAINLADYKDAVRNIPETALIAALGKIYRKEPALSYGTYRELLLTNRQFAFERALSGRSLIVTVNNDENPAEFSVSAPDGTYTGALFGGSAAAENGNLPIRIEGRSGEIWVPEGETEFVPLEHRVEEKEGGTLSEEKKADDLLQKAEEAEKKAGTSAKSYEEMSVEELQGEILKKMAGNGPVTDQMKRSVMENVWHDSLVSWVKSFR